MLYASNTTTVTAKGVCMHSLQVANKPNTGTWCAARLSVRARFRPGISSSVWTSLRAVPAAKIYTDAI